MPRRSILSSAERDSLFALPDTQDGLIRHYTLSESDLAIINQHRGASNRLGFAVQLCTMRYPGVMLGADEAPFPPLMKLVAAQLKVAEACWSDYGQRGQTRREHLTELQSVFGFQLFAGRHYRAAGHGLDDLAGQTDKALLRCLKKLGHGDTLIVWKLDQIGRSLRDLITMLDSLRDRGVKFRSITEAIDTETPTGRVMWQMIGMMAEYEHSLISERTRAGVKDAKKRGVKFGRKKKLGPSQITKARKLFEAGERVEDVAALWNVGRTTL